MMLQKFQSTAKQILVIFLYATLIALPGYGQTDLCVKYPHFAPYNPPLSDDSGWTKEMYYSTIQTADIDGDGQDELIARAQNGILAWHYDPIGQTWISMPGVLGLSDDIGYSQPQYYSTIQFAVLSPSSSPQASLLVRAPDGIHVYRYNTPTQNWIEIGVNAATRAFPDSAGWSFVQSYSTIQTADLDGDKIPELIGRHSSGLQVWFWNNTTGTWGKMVQTDLASDAEGYNQEQFYYPVMFTDLNRDGRSKVLLRTDTVGVQAYEFNGSAFAQITSTIGPFASGFQEPRFYKSMRAFTDSTGAYVLSLATAGATDTEQLVLYTWNGTAFGNETYIPLSYAGWDQLSQIVTIQTVDFDGDGRAEILARGQYGVYVYQQSNTGWTNSINVLSAFGDAYGFNLPQSYWTIQPARVQVANQGSFSNRTVILGRTSHGIQTYWLLNGEWRGDIAGFPAWANGAQGAAYGYISNQLDSNSDYDIRSTYKSSLSTYKTWDGYFTTVNTMTYPGSGVPNSNPVDFDIVRKSMATELRYVATVYAWFDNNKNVTDYMYGQSANNLTAVTGAVQLSESSTDSVVVEWLAQIASIVGTMAGGFGASEFAAVAGELSIGLSIASAQSGGISLASTVAALGQQLTDQQNELKNVNTCRITDFVTSYGALKMLGEADIAWTKPLGNDVLFDLQVRASTGLEAWMYSVIAPAAWETWTCEPQPQRNENPNGCPDENLPAASIWTWDQPYHYAYLWLIDGGVPAASVLNRLFGKYENGGIGASLNDVYFGRNGWALNGTMSCSDESWPSCGPDAPMPAYQRCFYCPQLPGPTSYSTSLATQNELSDERSMAKGSPPDRSPIQFSLKEDSRKSRAIAAIHGLRADILATVRDRTAQERMLAPLNIALDKLRKSGAVPEGYIDNLLRILTLRGEFHRDREIPSIHLNRHHAKAHAIRALVVDRTKQIQAMGRPKR